MRDKGFTLIEVMVSLAIVGALMITLIYTINYHLGIAETHETETIGTLLAKEMLFSITNSPEESEGEFKDPYKDYRFKVSVLESPYPDAVELKVTVSKGTLNTSLSKLVRGSIEAAK